MPRQFGEEAILFVIDDFKGRKSTENDSIIVLSARAYFLAIESDSRLYVGKRSTTR